MCIDSNQFSKPWIYNFVACSSYKITQNLTCSRQDDSFNNFKWLKWSKVIHNTQSAQISQKQDEHNIYAILKKMYPPGYHRSGFLAIYVLSVYILSPSGIHFEWRISDFRFQIESWPKSDLKSQPCAYCATGSNHWAIWQNNELWDVLNGLQDQGTTKLNI